MLYYQLRFRFQQVFNFKYTATELSGAERIFHGWNNIDIWAKVSSNFKQFGGGIAMANNGSLKSTKFSIGCIYRTDSPSDSFFKKIYIPLNYTFGLGGLPFAANENDKNWKKKLE